MVDQVEYRVSSISVVKLTFAIILCLVSLTRAKCLPYDATVEVYVTAELIILCISMYTVIMLAISAIIRALLQLKRFAL